MKTDFTGAFADFLEDRLGKALFDLREKNEEYRKLSDEYAALLGGQYHSAEEYRQAFSKIADVGVKLTDIEKRALFLAGMREHAGMEDAISSEDFKELFAGLK